MPITIQFRFRPVPPKLGLSIHHVYLHLRITVNGVRDSGFAARYRYVHSASGEVSFGEIIAIDKRQWVSRTQTLRGRDQPTIDLNNAIDSIKYAAKDTLVKQQQRYDLGKAPRPTTDSVKLEYQTGKPPAVIQEQFVYPGKFLQRKGKTISPGRMPPPLKPVVSKTTDLSKTTRLIDAFTAMLIELKVTRVATGRMAKSTYLRREAVLNYLKLYPPAEEITIEQVSAYWVEVFHAWLLVQPAGNPHHKFHDKRMGIGTATTYCACLTELMRWLKKQHIIPVNPLLDMDLERYKIKDVIFLEGVYLDRLFALQLDPPASVALWWFKLICLTGMDFPDAVRYAQARSLYETWTPGGKAKIVIRRAKPPQNECNIPILPALVELWDEVGGEAPRVISDSTLINYLEEIREKIDFPHRITPKIGRKTFGVILLKQYSIKSVSNALGHSTVHMTELAYVKVTGIHVDHEMDKVA